MTTYNVFGAGGFGREIMPWLEDHLSVAEGGRGLFKLRFLVDADVGRDALVNGYEARQFLPDLNQFDRYVVAVGDPRARKEIADRLSSTKAKAFRAIATYANVAENAHAGPGLIACPFATINPDSFMGRHCHLNIYSYVAHDAVLGDFVTLAPRASVNGECRVRDGAYLGTGAVLKEGIEVGAWATVGAGAVVLQNVPAGETWAGVPARRVK